MLEMLLGTMIVSSFITQLVLWWVYSFDRICGKIKLLMRSLEEQNEERKSVSLRNSREKGVAQEKV